MTAPRRTLLLLLALLLGCLTLRTEGGTTPTAAADGAVGASARRLVPEQADAASILQTSRRTGEPDVASPSPISAGPPSAPALIGADRWRAAGFTGYGVRVAIVDRGFAGYEALLGNGLPASTRARSFRADGNLAAGGDHGTLAARAVASMAPQTQLYLLAFSTQEELATLTAYLAQERIQVVSFSISFVFTGPGNGTGAVNDLIGRSVANGTFWAVSAGNWATQHWSGTFLDRSGNTVHEFAPGVEADSRVYRAQDLITVALRWDNLWGAACDDYDLELFDPDGSLIQASRGLQECHSDPVEKIEVLATRDGRYRTRVIRVAGSAARRFDLFMLGTPDRGEELEFSTASASLLEPADQPSVFTVGAASSLNLAQPSRFSSRGPTLDGRIKPDVLAPAGPQPFGDDSFAGTSAATSYAAGAAALLLEAYPVLSPRELADQLRQRALDAPPPGPDSDTGAGLLQMGTLSGLGPLLPAGASAAVFTTDVTQPNAALSVFRYRGPSGFPARFAYTLTGARTPAALYRLDIARARFDLFVMRAPPFVNTFDVFADGDFIFVRFQ